MIKAGIIGGSNPMAGELLRLLINHPDVEIMWVNSARYAGRLLSDVHHGLLGETSLRISPTADLDKIDVLFIFRNKGQTIEWLTDRVLPDDLRIIDLSVDMQDPDTADEYGFAYGLPELSRKVLVRGARRTIVPLPKAAISVLALLPLAKDEIIDHEIDIKVTPPRIDESPEIAPEELAAEIAYAIRELHPSFSEKITISDSMPEHDRAILCRVSLPTAHDIGELIRMYEEFYDDHNFVFISNGTEPCAKEVEGTNKCLIHLDKHDGRLEVTAIMDALLKGAAGTAVHDMNLLFGLHERTGLALKASRY